MLSNTFSNAFISSVNDLISITGYGSECDCRYGRVLGSSSASCFSYANTMHSCELRYYNRVQGLKGLLHRLVAMQPSN